jgi:GR25 family glycosyltransferase involved in LPS biosynthesis/phosphorylcholine metabolism protein LicD
MNYKYFIILLLLTIAIIIFIKFRNRREKLQINNLSLCGIDTECCEFPQFLHPCCVSNGIEMLRDVYIAFNKYNIPLWISYGTLLGLVRHKGLVNGFIPWDNDIDTSTLAEHADIIEDKISKELVAKGYTVSRETYLEFKEVSGDATAMPYDYFVVHFSNKNSLNLDIALSTVYKTAGKKYVIDGPKESHVIFEENNNKNNNYNIHSTLEKYKYWVYDYNYIFPLRQSKLYDVEVMIPNLPELLLKGMYTKDCLSKALVKKGTLPGTMNNLKETEITVFTPAIPLPKTSRSDRGANAYNIETCYIINMNKQSDRMYHAIVECDKYNLHVTRVDAVKNTDFDMDDFIKKGIYEDHHYKPFMYNGLRKNEVACYLSHVKALKMVASNKSNKPCIIFEDDIKMLKNFDKIMKDLSTKIKRGLVKFDIIFLGCRPYKKELLENENTKNTNLKKTGLTTGAWAYIVTPESARKILNNIFPIKYPFDLTITPPTLELKDNYADYNYDKRFLGVLDNYAIYDGEVFDDGRIGVVNELSTYAWKSGTSSLI